MAIVWYLVPVMMAMSLNLVAGLQKAVLTRSVRLYQQSVARTRSSDSFPVINTSRLHAYAPLKAMVFADGTWLYYSLVEGRNGYPTQDCISTVLGSNWKSEYSMDWSKLSKVISDHIGQQLKRQNHKRRDVEVTRIAAFTSLKPDTPISDRRYQMVLDFKRANFDVQKFETRENQEKCVDISLAVEMLYMSTLSDAFDIAVLVSGDRDFIPALEKVRRLAKRVAICSMRNSCNKDLCNSDYTIRDFDMIWLDDYIEELFVKKPHTAFGQTSIDTQIIQAIVDTIQQSPSRTYSSIALGRSLQYFELAPGKSILSAAKETCPSLRSFIERYPEYFEIVEASDRGSEYEYSVRLLSADSSSPSASGEDSSSPSASGEDRYNEVDEKFPKSQGLPKWTKLPYGGPPDEEIVDLLVAQIEEQGNGMSIRDIGRVLQGMKVDGLDLLQVVKRRYQFLRPFLDKYSKTFLLEPLPLSERNTSGTHCVYLNKMSVRKGEVEAIEQSAKSKEPYGKVTIDRTIESQEAYGDEDGEGNSEEEVEENRVGGEQDDRYNEYEESYNHEVIDKLYGGNNMATRFRETAESNYQAKPHSTLHRTLDAEQDDEDLSKLTVKYLKEKLKERGLPTLGVKTDLIARLEKSRLLDM